MSQNSSEERSRCQALLGIVHGILLMALLIFGTSGLTLLLKSLID